MADLAAAILARIPSTAAYRVGVVDTVSPLTVLIDGVSMAAVSASPVALVVREQVLVQVADGTAWVTSVLEPRPQSGTVVSVASGSVTVTAGGRTYESVPVAAGTATMGATVTLLWGSVGAVALAGGSTSAPASPPAPAKPDDPPPTPGGMDRDRWEDALIDARAIRVMTARSGSWRGDGQATVRAYQGRYRSGDSDNTGFIFYGGQTAVPGAIATGCRIRLVRPRQVGTAGPVDFRLRLHGAASPGGTPPAILSGAPIVASLRWGDSITVQLGADIGQRFLTGEARGIAVVYSGTSDYGALCGPTESTLACQLLIDHRRKATT